MVRDGVLARIRELYKKGLKTDDSVIESLIQEGVDDVNSKLLLFPTSKVFTLDAGINEYSIHEKVDDYLSPDVPGLKYKNDNGDFDKLYAYTLAQLFDEFPYWETQDDTDDIQRYVIDKNRLIIHPASENEQIDSAKLYYIKRTKRITGGNQYIFTGTTTSIPQFETLTNAVIYYVLAFLNSAYDEEVEFLKKLQIYEAEVKRQKKFINRRPDLTNDAQMRFNEVTTHAY